VSAYSDIGFGPWSAVSIELPGTPTAFAITRDALNHELAHVVWSPPTDAGSHPVTAYDIYANGVPLTSTSGLTLDVYLRSTIAWDVRVYAVNLIGRSNFPATVILPAG
jgi:hypothetical protein